MSRDSRFSWLLPSLLLVAGTIGLGAASLAPGGSGAPVAVVFPFWWGAAQSFEAVAMADGSILGSGGVPAVVIARSADPAFPARLRMAGAWLLLNPRFLGGCAATTGST